MRVSISAAIVFGHTKIPAGRLLQEADDLLKRRAKATRDAIAIALHKRSGLPVETVFPWEGQPSIQLLDEIVHELREEKSLASRQTYSLAEEHQLLTDVLKTREQWRTWLEWRLSRGEASRKDVARLATLLAPLFTADERRIEALRIARFLAFEAETKRRAAAPAVEGGAA
jgi:CRISPR/Cas system-associated protein Cas10 (large subunit of type III CRISPR-Cas system)